MSSYSVSPLNPSVVRTNFCLSSIMPTQSIMFKTNAGNDPQEMNSTVVKVFFFFFLLRKKISTFQGIPMLLNQVVRVFTHQSQQTFSSTPHHYRILKPSRPLFLKNKILQAKVKSDASFLSESVVALLLVSFVVQLAHFINTD